MKPDKILIVEDNQLISADIKDYMDAIGLETVVVGSAEEALEKVKMEKFDLFLIDIGLPGKNGIELISDLSNKLGIKSPVIVVTGQGTGKKFMEVTALGVRYFISKPFSDSSIINAVKMAIADASERGLYIEKDKNEDAQKYLMPIGGGAYVEFASFRHPLETDLRQRQVVCITCQAGCSSGCKFCRSGCTFKNGVENVDLKNMESQIFIAEGLHGFEKDSPVQGYFGGSGEPTLNDWVPELIESSSDRYTFRVSTVGIEKPLRIFIDRLSDNKKLVQLQISLHFPEDQLRSQHIRIAEQNPIEKILKLAEKFAEKSGTLVCLNYVLFQGINDSKEMIHKLAALAKNRPFFVRLSKANRFRAYHPTDKKGLNTAKAILSKNGIFFKEFHSRGTGIHAGCGQLVAAVNRYQGI